MINPETMQLMSNREYRRIYRKIIEARSRLAITNKNLLNEGKKHEYQCNCNILKGMNKVIEKLPKP